MNQTATYLMLLNSGVQNTMIGTLWGEYTHVWLPVLLVWKGFSSIFWGFAADVNGRRTATIAQSYIGVLGASLVALWGALSFWSLTFSGLLHTGLVLYFASGGGVYPVAAAMSAESTNCHARQEELGCAIAFEPVGRLLARCVLLLVAWSARRAVPVMTIALLSVAIFVATIVIGHVSCTESYLWCNKRLWLDGVDVQVSATEKLHLARQQLSTELALDATHDHRHYSAMSNMHSSPLQRQRAAWARYLRWGSRVVQMDVSALWGCCVPWFIHSVILYAMTMTHSLLKAPQTTEYGKQLFSVGIDCVSLVGYFLAVGLLLFWSPKMLQLVSLTVSAFIYFGLFLSLFSIAHTEASPLDITQFPAACFMYESLFLVVTVIPHVSTWMMATESFHTRIRCGTGGLAAAFASFGAAASLLLDRYLLFQLSRPTVLLVCVALALVAADQTKRLTPNVPGLDLAELHTIDGEVAKRNFIVEEEAPEAPHLSKLNRATIGNFHV